MIKYSFRTASGEGTVWLECSDPNQRELLQYDGQFLEFQEWLSSQSGAYGHLIKSATSPVDLHYALLSPSAQQFAPELIEGAELVQSYDPELPPGAIT